MPHQSFAEWFDSEDGPSSHETRHSDLQNAFEAGQELGASQEAAVWKNDEIQQVVSEEGARWYRISDQAQRYMEGCFGKSWVYMAPEAFENVLIRWIWAIASDSIDFAETQMAHIERMMREQAAEDAEQGRK